MAIIQPARLVPFAHEWEEFEVPLLADSPSMTGDCATLTEVAHVAHIANALRIIEDRCLTPRLVSDESVLRNTRTEVTWLSPNHWPNGYRYGNVAFYFNWATIFNMLRDPAYHWVETIRTYNPTACRILVTANEHPNLRTYNPLRDRGPWKQDATTNTHYWNERFTIEILLESELPLANATRIDFVHHHPTYCSLNWRTCQDRNCEAEPGGALFLAAVLGRALTIPDALLRPAPGQSPHHMIQRAANRITAHLLNRQCTGNIGADHPAALPLARGVLAAYARRSPNEVEALASLFLDTEELVRTYHTLFPPAAEA